MKRFQRRLCKNERQVKELMSDLGAQPTTHDHDLLLIFAVAFSRTGDPASREFGDAKVIRKFGDVPDSFEHAVKLHCVYNEIARMRGHIRAQEREIDMLNRAEMPTASGELLLARMRAKVDEERSLHRKKIKHFYRAGRPETRHQKSRRRHLARQLHAI